MTAQIANLHKEYLASTDEFSDQVQNYQSFLDELKRENAAGDHAALAQMGKIFAGGGRVSNFDLQMLSNLGNISDQARGEIRRLLSDSGATFDTKIRTQIRDLATDLFAPKLSAYLQARENSRRQTTPLNLTPEEIRNEITTNRYPSGHGLIALSRDDYRAYRAHPLIKPLTETAALIRLLKQGRTLAEGPD
jgi:hypothetical protein